MINATLGRRFISALSGQPAKAWFSFGPMGHLFDDDPTSKSAWEFMHAYALAHGVVPSAATVAEECGVTLPKDPGEPHWLHGKLCERYAKRQLLLLGEDVQKLLTSGEPLKALDVMHRKSGALVGAMASLGVHDFRNAILEVWPHLIEKWSGQRVGVPWPWQTMQIMAGDVYGGEMVSIVGRPGLGKTYQMLWVALNIWKTLQRPVLFVSMEIAAMKLMERIAAMFAGIPIDFFKDGVGGDFFGGPNLLANLKEKLTILNDDTEAAALAVVDANLSATVDDILALCRRVEPCAVFVDGAYLLKTSDPRATRTEAIYQVAEALKRDVATACDVPVFGSWQFNRDSMKTKKGETPGLEHIAGGDAIGQLSSVVMGLFEDVDSSANIEHVARRKMHILKGRDGESGSFVTKWDFLKMDFSEAKPEDESLDWIK